MILPNDLQQKINDLYLEINKEILVSSRENLTQKYQAKLEIGKSIIESKNDSIVYAISRMPATYAVLVTLIGDLIDQNKLCDIKSVIDVGSGTGAGFFACKEIFENADISLFERDKNMIEIFNRLEPEKRVEIFDFSRDEIKINADLVMSSYVLSELNEATRISAVKKMINCSNKYVLIVDTGTPRTYENFMKLKKIVGEMGLHVIAPCESEKCGLKNDYCQFYARVERSSLLKMSKQATESYEDEKYFYLLISKEDCKINENRVIRRPEIKTNFVELKVCSNVGIKELKITKKDKEIYKKSKKIKINQIV